MSAFEYKALDSKGREVKGVLEGDTARQIRQQLRDRGLNPVEVEEVSERNKTTQGRTATLFRGVSVTDLAILTRQLATLISAALPVEEALQTVAKQTEKSHHKSMLMAIRSKVMEGYTMAEGFAEFPDVFSELFRTTVAAGEQSGHLDLILERLADYTENRQHLIHEMQKALFYPVILVIVAVSLTSFLLVYIVPEVIQAFQTQGRAIPGLTQFLIDLSDFLQAHGGKVIIAIIAFFVVFKRALRNKALLYRWHLLLQRIPLVSRLFRGSNTARFARTFSIMTASGVPVLESMRIATEVMTSLPMRELVAKASHRVREGSSIYKALEQTHVFPPLVVHLIASGESSGKLEQMLSRAADNQERELERLIGMLMGILEPLLLVAMGAVVMLIVMGILLPIFEMNQLVQ
jgi:general secretion pathway protein F